MDLVYTHEELMELMQNETVIQCGTHEEHDNVCRYLLANTDLAMDGLMEEDYQYHAYHFMHPYIDEEGIHGLTYCFGGIPYARVAPVIEGWEVSANMEEVAEALVGFLV